MAGEHSLVDRQPVCIRPARTHQQRRGRLASAPQLAGAPSRPSFLRVGAGAARRGVTGVAAGATAVRRQTATIVAQEIPRSERSSAHSVA